MSRSVSSSFFVSSDNPQCVTYAYCSWKRLNGITHITLIYIWNKLYHFRQVKLYPLFRISFYLFNLEKRAIFFSKWHKWINIRNTYACVCVYFIHDLRTMRIQILVCIVIVPFVFLYAKYFGSLKKRTDFMNEKFTFALEMIETNDDFLLLWLFYIGAGLSLSQKANYIFHNNIHIHIIYTYFVELITNLSSKQQPK